MLFPLFCYVISTILSPHECARKNKDKERHQTCHMSKSLHNYAGVRCKLQWSDPVVGIGFLDMGQHLHRGSTHCMSTAPLHQCNRVWIQAKIGRKCEPRFSFIWVNSVFCVFECCCSEHLSPFTFRGWVMTHWMGCFVHIIFPFTATKRFSRTEEEKK